MDIDFSQIATLLLVSAAAVSVIGGIACLILIMWEVAKEFDREYRRRTGGR